MIFILGCLIKNFYKKQGKKLEGTMEDQEPEQTIENEWSREVNAIIENLKKIIKESKTSITLKFSKEKLFAGDFYHFQYDCSEKEDTRGTEKIRETQLFITDSRKIMFSKLFDEFKVALLEKMNQIFSIDGPQGIGKTYSLLILASTFRKNSKIRFVFIQNSKRVNIRSWKEILDQFICSFPEYEEHLNKLKNSDNDSDIIIALKKILREYAKKGVIVVLIFDQINFLDTEGVSLLLNLKSFEWAAVFLSQSSNNQDEKPVKDARSIFQENLTNRSEFKSILDYHFEKRKNEKLITPDFTIDYDELIKYTGFIPREGIRVLDSKGSTFQEKLETYVEQRAEEISAANMNFKFNQIHDYALSIFFMDTDIPMPLSINFPIINRQFQICKKENKEKKIYSTFPFACKVLKSWSIENFKLPSDFFQSRISTLKVLFNTRNLDAGVRGRYYEELINTLFKNHQRLKNDFDLFAIPVGSLRDKPKELLKNEVCSLKYLILILIFQIFRKFNSST